MSDDWRAILFDLDGTLADTIPLIVRCYRHTMEVHLGRELPDADWLRTVGLPLTEQFRDFARDPDEAARMLETYVTFQRSIHDESVSAFAGTAAVLDALRARGLRLGVVTNKRRELAMRTLRCCGLLDHMEVLVGADEVRAGKPDPEPVRLALERLGLGDERDRERVVLVGDSPYDILAGRGAGVRTAALLRGPFSRAVLEQVGPDYVLAELEELLELRP